MGKEYERVKTAIANILYGETTYENYLARPKVRKAAEVKIDQILSLDGILIKSDDPSLPVCNRIKLIDFDKHTFTLDGEPLQNVCPLLKAGFVRCIPKEQTK